MRCLLKCMWAAGLLLAVAPAGAQTGATLERPMYPVEVIVSDQDGQPVPGAEISWGGNLARFRDHSTPKERSEWPHTDASGKCTVDLPGDGVYSITVRRDGYMDASDPGRLAHSELVQAVSGKSVKVFADLVRGAAFRGTVYMEDGRVAPGSVVRLQQAALDWSGPVRGVSPARLQAKADADGNYLFPLVPPGQYGMWITPPVNLVTASLAQSTRGDWTGYGTVVWHSSVEEIRRITPVSIAPGEDARGYNVVLRKTRVYPFAGTLRNPTGEPLKRATFSIRMAGEGPATLLEPHSANPSNGDFDIPALPEGNYELLVYRDEAPFGLPYAVAFNPALVPVTRPDGGPPQRRRQVFEIPPWNAVTGRIMLTRLHPDALERPLGSISSERVMQLWHMAYDQPAVAAVILTPVAVPGTTPEDGARIRSVESRSMNQRLLPDAFLPPGQYTLAIDVSEPWYAAAARIGDRDLLQEPAARIRLDPGAGPLNVEVELRQGGAAVEGTVIDEKGQPVANAAMCAAASDALRHARPGGAFCVHADAQGAFRSLWMSPGEWKIWGFKRLPRASPYNPDFEAQYGSRAQKLNVAEESDAPPRRSLFALE